LLEEQTLNKEKSLIFWAGTRGSAVSRREGDNLEQRFTCKGSSASRRYLQLHKAAILIALDDDDEVDDDGSVGIEIYATGK
jgi:hypothetical protein